MATDQTEPAVESTQPTRIVLDFNFDAGDLEDIEEYTGLTNAFSLLANAVEGIPPGRQVQALASKLPAKMVTAVLGVARRRADPTWTMDRWREFRFADLGDVNGISGEESEPEPDPTSSAAPTSTGGASPNGSRNSKPAQASDTTG